MTDAAATGELTIEAATIDDVPCILDFIKELAAYERLAHEVVATEESLRATLFGDHPFAEVILGRYENETVAFALFFHNYSTFLGRPGIYLEDIYVSKRVRGRGFGKQMLRHIARLACERDCGRLEWSVLDWNQPAIDFYEGIGAAPMRAWTTFRLTDEALRAAAEL